MTDPSELDYNTAGTTESINASPSKGLFIVMLVRDIELRAAIGDLVDNSVDGARRRQRKAGEDDGGDGISLKKFGENDDLRWPHRDGLIWPHFSSVVVGLDVA